MEFDDLHQIRGPGARTDGDGSSLPEISGEPLRGAGIAPNPVTELVADLLETTGLIAPERTLGSEPGRLSNSISTLPPSRSFSAGAAPR